MPLPPCNLTRGVIFPRFGATLLQFPSLLGRLYGSDFPLDSVLIATNHLSGKDFGTYTDESFVGKRFWYLYQRLIRH